MARRWADDNRDSVRGHDPETGELFNRTADNWRPLFAIADVAGGAWSARARAAAAAGRIQDQDSIRAKLLADIQDIMAGRSQIASAELALTLSGLEGRPWAEWRNGKPLTATALARLLAPFGIAPGTKRHGDETFKGYLATDFALAFECYLPARGVTPSQSVKTGAIPTVFKSSQGHGCDGSGSVTDPHEMSGCDDVTDETGDADEWQFHKEPAPKMPDLPDFLRRTAS